MDLPENLSGILAGKRVPDADLLDRCAKTLEIRGWKREIAGGANFEKGVKAWAYALLNGMGLFVTGAPGTGKTKYLESVTAAKAYQGSLVVFRLKDPRDQEYINRHLYRDYAEECLEKDVFIDDLGAEETVCEYGTRFEPAVDFIFAHLRRGTQGRNLFINTNYVGSTLLDRYTGRLDEIKEFFVPCHFTGESVRQWLRPV